MGKFDELVPVTCRHCGTVVHAVAGTSIAKTETCNECWGRERRAAAEEEAARRRPKRSRT